MKFFNGNVGQFFSTTIPVRKALIWIFLFTLLISGLPTLFYLYLQRIDWFQSSKREYEMRWVQQTPREGAGLSSAYLAEILGLSTDVPLYYADFSVEKAQDLLEKHPVILWAHVEKRSPGILLISYEMRKPVAVVDNYTNTAVDASGVLIPIAPFYEHFPERHVRVGAEGLGEDIAEIQSHIWGKTISPKYWEKVKFLQEAFEKRNPSLRLVRIDLSRLEERSEGKREIILHIEFIENAQPYQHILRLAVDGEERGLDSYEALLVSIKEKNNKKDCTVVDLRLPQLAFLS